MTAVYWWRDVSTVTPVHAPHADTGGLVWFAVGEKGCNHQTWEGTAMAFTSYAQDCPCHFLRFGGTLACHQLDIINVVFLFALGMSAWSTQGSIHAAETHLWQTIVLSPVQDQLERASLWLPIIESWFMLIPTFGLKQVPAFDLRSR